MLERTGDILDYETKQENIEKEIKRCYNINVFLQNKNTL